MRILLTIILSCSLAYGGKFVGGPTVKPFGRADAGYMVFDTFERDSLGSDWWNRGGATVSMYNSNMLVYQASAAIITNYVMFTNWYTACENFIAEWDQTPIATNSTTAGVFFAMKAASFTQLRNVWAGVYLASDGNVGRAMVGKNDNVTLGILATAPAGRAITGFGGVPIHVVVSVTNNTWHCFATNPANGSYTHTNYTFSYAEAGNLVPVASYFSFNILAGSNVIDNFKIRMNVRTPTYVLGIGKSIDSGSAATNQVARYWGRVFTNANYPSYVNAAGSDATTNWMRRFREFQMYRPKYNFLGMSSDVIQGVASNTWSANLATIANTVRGWGGDINFMASTPHDTADQRGYNLAVSNAPTAIGVNNNPILAGWTRLRTNDSSAHPPFYHADLIHPNAAGHEQISLDVIPRYLRP